jgi:peptide/nickel transport system ATP-binding protein
MIKFIPHMKILNLSVEYAVREGWLKVVSRVSLDIPEAKITGLVGESGCGKTSLVDAIFRTLPPNGYIKSGKIWFRHLDLLSLSKEEMRKIRWKKIAMVFQAAQNSLNPALRIRDHFIETYRAHDEKASKDEILNKASEMLKMVRLNPYKILNSFPYELSGGMKQRVIIALSLLLNPEFLILDEPSSALDIYTQSTIIDMLKDIHKEKDLTMLFVTHDLPVLAEIADYIAVMYAGKIVEFNDVESIFYEPKHPYTRLLIKSIPSLIGNPLDKKPVPGEPQSLLNPPPGCRFHPRCPYKTLICEKDEPNIFYVNGGFVACWLYEGDQVV